MITLIIKKELKEIIGSTKFAVSFGVCAVLILLTFFVGVQNHKMNVSRYEAARAQNLRKMEGLTDWMRVNDHRIFLPPKPLESLVNGISNDIGRTIEMSGRGELTAEHSRYNEDPVFAVFRFLDLQFVFTIVLSLFAILFAYDAVNGEKERGTLKLQFSNALPRSTYLLGKWIGSFSAVAVPLMIPILLGCLMLPLMGVQLTGEEYVRLFLIIGAGLLYFGFFLSLSLFVSVMTHRSATSFLVLLISWIFIVLIIPRSAVLLAGRAVAVPSVDELSHQKSQYRAQLWREDREAMSSYKAPEGASTQEVVQGFTRLMSELSEKRDDNIDEFNARLNEGRTMKQRQQEQLAFGLSRISPGAVFSLAATYLANTSLELKSHFSSEAAGYQKTYGQFKKEKTGMNQSSGMVVMAVRVGDGEEEEKPIDLDELPTFMYSEPPLGELVNRALFDVVLLVLYTVLLLAGSFVAFIRYDVR
ncbi:ABC transporter permease subunit [bacterium]|nr:ABC transporter permease subunit [bacterium]